MLTPPRPFQDRGLHALAICGVADVNAAEEAAAPGGRPAARRLPQQRPDPPRAAPQDRADRHPMSARPPAAYVRQRQPRRRCRSREAGSAWQGAPVYRLSASTACSRLLRNESPQMKGSRQNQHGPRPAKITAPNITRSAPDEPEIIVATCACARHAPPTPCHRDAANRNGTSGPFGPTCYLDGPQEHVTHRNLE
jgi:hypothetical protein